MNEPPHDKAKVNQVWGDAYETNEVIVFDRMLKEHERDKIEASLAHKWGLVEKLPNNHS